ncbi:MAG: glycosyltransferase family 2 protein [Caldimicrobium sp.]|nr:glycosyltransferase family 2 protein [Caldimicrobium sp.]
MKNNPKVSVIIPTIGRKSLIRTLESVLNQTYQNLEIIITDDTEEGKAKPLIERYLTDPRIKYVINTKYKHGPSGNKNNGLDNITGEYFTMVDDDDIIMPNAIEELLSVAIKGNYNIVFANCVDNIEGKFTGLHYGKDEEVSLVDFLCGRYEGDYFIITKTSILENNRFNDECWGGEGILWLRLWKKVGVGFYLHKALKIVSIDNQDRVSFQYVKKAKRTYLNYVLFLQEFGNDIKHCCPRNFIRFSLPGIYYSVLAREYKQAFKMCVASVKMYPKLFFVPVLWMLFCMLFPDSFVIQFYKKYSKRFKKFFKILSTRRAF